MVSDAICHVWEDWLVFPFVECYHYPFIKTLHWKATTITGINTKSTITSTAAISNTTTAVMGRRFDNSAALFLDVDY